MIKITENQDEMGIALAAALGNGRYWKAYDDDHLFKNRAFFLECCAVYFDNRKYFNDRHALISAPPQFGTKKNSKTQIYLMINQRNGQYKIGRSNNPKVRETTLQSEEPDIHLLRSWIGTISDEEFLHITFAEWRTRGEWFKLPGCQVELLYKIMEKRTQNENTTT